MYYRNSLKPHQPLLPPRKVAVSSFGSVKAGTALVNGEGGEVIEMTHMNKNIQINLFCDHLILTDCDPSDMILDNTELSLKSLNTVNRPRGAL